jgi:non-ribosomal peptide synthetase component E (peptide arylation enzyme)
MLPDNLGHLFDAPLRLAPDSPAVFQDDVRLTYAELDARCNRLATGLARLGIGAGDRVPTIDMRVDTVRRWRLDRRIGGLHEP